MILRDRSSVVRAEAVRALCRLCPHGEAGLSALPSALREGEPSEPRRAAEALEQIAEIAGARVAASQLARALGDPDARIRWKAAEALGKVGAAAPEVVPALTAALDDAEVVVRRKATRSLGWIGPAAGSAVPRLAVALSDPVRAARVEAALALVGIRPAARASVPALIGAAGGADDSLRFAIIQALGPIGVEVQIHAAAARGFMDAEAEEAIPGLIRALRTRDFRVRARAAIALGRICALPFETLDTTWTVFGLFPRITVPRYPDAAFDAADALAQALRDGEREVRLAACTAIGRLRYLARPHRAYLSWMHRHDPDREVAAAALEAHLAAQWREKWQEQRESCA